MQSSGSIDEHHIRAVGFGGLQGIEGYGSRIGTLLLLDDRHAYAFAPYA